MRFRPLRSKAFWFGLPGLVFLLWTWELSKTCRTHVTANSDVSELLFGQVDGDVVLIRGPGPLPPHGEWEIVHEPLTPGLAESIKREARELAEAGISTVFFVPHGWLVAAYLSAWSGLAVWRRAKHGASSPVA
jgi:hypothetical protein